MKPGQERALAILLRKAADLLAEARPISAMSRHRGARWYEGADATIDNLREAADTLDPPLDPED